MKLFTYTVTHLIKVWVIQIFIISIIFITTFLSCLLLVLKISPLIPNNSSPLHKDQSTHTTYGTSPASLAGPISERVVNPVALIATRQRTNMWRDSIIAYPLPRPGTYPSGAGWPKNDFLFLPTNMGGGCGGMGTSRCILSTSLANSNDRSTTLLLL